MDVTQYLFRQGTRIYQPVANSCDGSHRRRSSLLSPLLTFGCPNLQLCLIDRFLEGQRAYYTPCQIPSRRCESVHYSIAQWWLNLLLCFELIFLLPWWVHSSSEQTNARKLVRGNNTKLLESTRCQDIPRIMLNWLLCIDLNAVLGEHKYTFRKQVQAPCSCGWAGLWRFLKKSRQLNRGDSRGCLFLLLFAYAVVMFSCLLRVRLLNKDGALRHLASAQLNNARSQNILPRASMWYKWVKKTTTVLTFSVRLSFSSHRFPYWLINNNSLGVHLLRFTPSADQNLTNNENDFRINIVSVYLLSGYLSALLSLPLIPFFSVFAFIFVWPLQLYFPSPLYLYLNCFFFHFLPICSAVSSWVVYNELFDGGLNFWVVGTGVARKKLARIWKKT